MARGGESWAWALPSAAAAAILTGATCAGLVAAMMAHEGYDPGKPADLTGAVAIWLKLGFFSWIAIAPAALVAHAFRRHVLAGGFWAGGLAASLAATAAWSALMPARFIASGRVESATAAELRVRMAPAAAGRYRLTADTKYENGPALERLMARPPSGPAALRPGVPVSVLYEETLRGPVARSVTVDLEGEIVSLEGRVADADAGHVTVRAQGGTSTFRLSPSTDYVYFGAWHLPRTPAGAGALAPGGLVRVIGVRRPDGGQEAWHVHIHVPGPPPPPDAR